MLRYTTRAGLTHVVDPPEQPVCEDPTVGGLWEALVETQPKTAELLDALEDLRAHRHIIEQTELEAELLGQREEPGWWDTPPFDPGSALLR